MGRENVVEKGETTFQRIVEDILLVIFLRTVVVIGSRSHDELNYCDSKLVISSRVAGVKEGKTKMAEGGE